MLELQVSISDLPHMKTALQAKSEQQELGKPVHLTNSFYILLSAHKNKLSLTEPVILSH